MQQMYQWLKPIDITLAHPCTTGVHFSEAQRRYLKRNLIQKQNQVKGIPVVQGCAKIYQLALATDRSIAYLFTMISLYNVTLICEKICNKCIGGPDPKGATARSFRRKITPNDIFRHTPPHPPCAIATGTGSL